MSQGPSTLDKIQFVIGAFGAIAAGLFFAFGPPDLRAEIPIHFELGMGFIAFGALMFAALFFVRAKSLLLSFVTGLFAAGFAVVAYNSGIASWQFYVYGILAILIAIFSLSCLRAIFTGDDPVD